MELPLRAIRIIITKPESPTKPAQIPTEEFANVLKVLIEICGSAEIRRAVSMSGLLSGHRRSGRRYARRSAHARVVPARDTGHGGSKPINAVLGSGNDGRAEHCRVEARGHGAGAAETETL